MRLRSFVSAVLFSTLALIIGGCGGGGGGGGTAATPSVSSGVAQGTISGFGSIIVDGVEFNRKTGLADDRIKLRFENNTSAAENNLKTGMNVIVKWELNNFGQKVYKEIEFRPELRGPVDDTTAFATTSSTFKVMGRTVQIEANTVFDSVTDFAELKAQVEAIQPQHPELEISGNLDDAGILHATRIARKALDFNALTTKTAEIKGAISSVTSSTSFTIGTITVNFAAGALSTNTTAADIVAGALVEVKGILSGTTLTATRIEKKNALGVAQVEDNFKVKGLVSTTGLNSTTKAFTLNTPVGAISVTTDANTQILKGGAVAAFSDVVAAGAKLEVEGTVKSGGSILATKVSVEVEKTVKLEGNTTAAPDVSTSAGTVKLNGVTAFVTSLTRFADTGGATFTSLSNINVFDHLQISGFIDANNNVVASQIQRSSKNGVIFIQGPVTAKDATATGNLRNLTILGVSVQTDAVLTTFNDITKLEFTTPKQSNFFTAITVNQTVVKAKFTAGQAFADEVEIEQKL